MFQNSFQNGNYFELFDPKAAQDKQKNLYKLLNINANNKVFDKDLKTYVFEFNTPNAKIVFPKQDKKDLYLIQQYLVFQIFFYPGMSWSMQLVVSDLNKTKRRIMLSPATNKLQIKPFFVKHPNTSFKQGVWNNFSIDLYSFMEAFKGQSYRCLDTITMMGHFKLRRIYTTNTLPQQDFQDQMEGQSMKQINLLPKHFYFPPGLEQSSQLNRYSGQTLSQINLYEPTQPSTKNNSSYLKSSKHNRISTPKTQTVKSQKIVQVSNFGKSQKSDQKQFLANTNGPEMLNRMRKNQKYNQSSDSQSHITDNVKTPQSTEKNEVKSKKKLIKTQVMPPKARSSVDKRQKSKIEQKQKIKSKLNPWRMNAPKRSETSKVNPLQDQSDIGSSPNTTQFKANTITNKFNESINKVFDRKSDHYSESQYIQLSQKFSTITDGKFLNNNRSSNTGQKSYLNHPGAEFDNNEQIQQNIQMQTNSMYSSSNRKNQKEARDLFSKFQNQGNKQQIINESICDSLDRRSPKKDFDVIGRQSYYGFAQRLMNEYMKQKQRPYSPPMIDRDRQYTQQEQYKNELANKQQKQVELVYDPVLNCYYDHKTHTYYELKN